MDNNNNQQATILTGHKHDKTISVAKGIGILLMVVGHAGAPDAITRWLYLFHMPLFFFISGYLLKDSYLQDRKSAKKFLKNKILSLYKPFVMWVILFVLLHNLLASLHIYSFSYSSDEVRFHIFQTFLFRIEEGMLGGYWFLWGLFYSSVVAFTILYFNQRLHLSVRLKARKGVIPFVESLLILLLAFVSSLLNFKHAEIRICLFAAAFFLAGKSYFEMQLSLNWKIAVGLLMSVVIFSSVYSEFMEVLGVTGVKMLIMYTVALISITGILHLCKLIKGRMLSFLDYLGRNTMDILTFHLLTFKAVSLLLIVVSGLEIERLSDFPVLTGLTGYEWILYTIAGVTLPLLLAKTLASIKYSATTLIQKSLKLFL